jgi:hypothetical protein
MRVAELLGGDDRTMEATMSARTGRLLLAAGLALAPALVLAQDRAVPRGGGSGGSHGGSSDSGSRHTSPGVSSGGGSSSSSSSSSSGSYHAPSNAERRHPRAGTGRGGGGGYYPGYPGYPGWGWGGGWYYPGYGGYWWPYGYYGWYGGYGSYWGYPGGWGGGGGVYYYDHREGGSLRVLVDPAEARVYVDGYYAGVVDDFDGLLQRLHVSPGRHEIALKLEGYKTHRMRVYVGPDATVKLHHEMEKGVGETSEDLTGGAPPPEREVRREREDEDRPPVAEDEVQAQEFGRLQLDVQPEDASVYVDGAFRGSGREASSLRLAPGRHRIEVVRPGYRTAESDVDVPAGETTRLKVILDRPSV